MAILIARRVLTTGWVLPLSKVSFSLVRVIFIDLRFLVFILSGRCCVFPLAIFDYECLLSIRDFFISLLCVRTQPPITLTGLIGDSIHVFPNLLFRAFRVGCTTTRLPY